MSKERAVMDGLAGFGDPFHEGEIAVQERTGERKMALHAGTVLRDSLVPAARAFLAVQNTVALGTTGPDGRLWAGVWFGWPGFARSEDGRTMYISHRRSADEPLDTRLEPGRNVGILAIDLTARRRVRINGVVKETDEEGISIDVREAFPNCPKYIQRRELTVHMREPNDQPTRRGSTLDAERRSFVERIDTMFVASRHPTRGVDVSHRGGARGFVRVLDERTLRIPDYEGNGMFQTMGNFEVEPRAGIIMVDFERGRYLSLTGDVKTSYGIEDPNHPTGGTRRYWQLDIVEWVETAMPQGLAFRFIDSSPFNPHDPGPECQRPS